MTTDSGASARSTGARPRAAHLDLPARLGPRALFLCGLVALIVAGVGEMLLQAGQPLAVGVALYVIAIALFALTSRPAESPLGGQSTESFSAEAATSSIRLPVGLVVGGALAVALDAGALVLLARDLRSGPGQLLWLLNLVAILVAGVLARHGDGWPPRWQPRLWPVATRDRVPVVLAIVAILALAACARLLYLDLVPQGINADEGDRAALAIQIARGDNTRGVFDDGWYYVSMLYFWLLAQVMKLVGIGYAQARVFSAVAGVVAVGVVIWLGARHFGWRVGLLAGALTSMLGVALQFSRETSESGPTGLLWAVSAALFLEAARRGKSWAWIGAGIAGGLSFYFYTTGRLWPVFAALWCVYLFVREPDRKGIARGTALAALAGVLAASPFFLRMSQAPQLFTLRAQQTSIFTADNVTRLPGYHPGLTMPELLKNQVDLSLGLFNRVSDHGGFWPTNRPIMWGLLATLTLVGVGWISVRWRDPRWALLGLWFWMGLISVVVTVETPNLQRIAVAVPMLAIPAVLVLDDVARRAESAWPTLRERMGHVIRPATAIAGFAVGGMMLQQGMFYFGEYARMDPWAYRTLEGRAISQQGSDTLVVTLGRDFFQINSGWIRLMAPFTPRIGLKSPGSYLPLTRPADTNLAFSLYPRGAYYLPYLQELYPGGTVVPYQHPREGAVVTVYRISRDEWRATQGATVLAPDGGSSRVDRLGEAPADWRQTYPATLVWTAGLRVPAYGNYAFRLGPGPGHLVIDGVDVLTVPEGSGSGTATVGLSGGDHALRYVANRRAPGTSSSVYWTRVPDGSPGALEEADWREVPTELLISSQQEPMGLFASAQVEGRPEQRWVDRAVATCCMSQHLATEGRIPYVVTWTGALHPPSAGAYALEVWAQGLVELKIDGQSVLRGEVDGQVLGPVTVELAEPQALELVYRVAGGAGGIELVWTRPDGVRSIIPPSALTPAGVTVGPPVPAAALSRIGTPPREYPFETVK